MRDPVKQKIQELCPDVMDKDGVKAGTRLKHAEGWETVAIGPVDKNNGVSHENGYGPIASFGVIGRPITLAVVLRAIDKPVKYYTKVPTIHNDVCKLLYLWNLEHDNYDQQSEETKQFIGSLLGV